MGRILTRKICLERNINCCFVDSIYRTEPVEAVQVEVPLEVASDTDDDAFLPDVEDDVAASPTSMRIYSPKPRVTVQRRATVTGASPTSSRPPVDFEQVFFSLLELLL